MMTATQTSAQPTPNLPGVPPIDGPTLAKMFQAQATAVELLEKDPGNVLCYRYDVVLNGFEIGGENYLLPVDASLKSDRDVADETGVSTRSPSPSAVGPMKTIRRRSMPGQRPMTRR